MKDEEKGFTSKCFTVLPLCVKIFLHLIALSYHIIYTNRLGALFATTVKLIVVKVNIKQLSWSVVRIS